MSRTAATAPPSRSSPTGKTVPLARRRRHPAGRGPRAPHDADGDQRRRDGRLGPHPPVHRPTGYACLEQVGPGRVPTLAKLADTFVISDRTFQLYTPSSWGAHLELVSADLDGFIGDNPPAGFGQFFGWGCDSGNDAAWKDPNAHGSGTDHGAVLRSRPTGAGPVPGLAGAVHPHDHGPPGLGRPLVEDLRAHDRGSGAGIRPGDLPDLLRVPGLRPVAGLRPVEHVHPRRAGRRPSELLHRDPHDDRLSAQQDVADGGGQLDRRAGERRDVESGRVEVHGHLHHLRRLRMLLRPRRAARGAWASGSRW